MIGNYHSKLAAFRSLDAPRANQSVQAGKHSTSLRADPNPTTTSCESTVYHYLAQCSKRTIQGSEYHAKLHGGG
jgi:hypothetical protein